MRKGAVVSYCDC